MIRFMSLLLLVLFTALPLSAFERVPKQYILEAGAIYAHSNDISGNKTPGFTVMFDYAWQLSGLDGTRKKSFISVPIGYTYFPENPTMGILSYGWTIRHNLLKDRAVIPFLGYGLLLNQLSFELDAGKRFGHQTRFDVGAEWFEAKPVSFFTKAEWSMTRFPQQTQSSSDWLYTIALKVGVRITRPPREPKEKESSTNSPVEPSN